MTASTRRITAVVRADFLVRFRRPSTVVVFLLLGFFAYLWVPAPATGRALIQIDGHRALYNSAALGMATALLGTICIGLFAFYVVSNAIQRDVRSRCGSVIAATGVRSSEYLVGKVLGNVLFLCTFMAGFMLTSMAMVLVRGEAPLEPLVFVWQYLLLVPPSIVMVSVVAILFESIPFLSGRFGDVAYFFLWIGLLVPATALAEKGASNSPTWLAYVDASSFAFLFIQLRVLLHTTAVSIGASPFDPALSPIVFPGLSLAPEWILPRVTSTFAPLVLFPIALVFFHRFDPARIGRSVARTREGLFARVQRWIKPLTRPVVALLMGRPGRGQTSILGAARRDAALTLGASPLAPVALIVFSLAALGMPTEKLLRGLVPVLVAVIGVVLADVSCRERRAGTMGLVWASPLLKPAFVRWKVLTALFLSLLFAAVPLGRLAIARPWSVVAMLVGLAFLSSAATMLGVVSSNPKTFIVTCLSFWYVVTNDGGRTAALDFAGFYGRATPTTVAGYGALAVAFTAIAEAAWSAELRRDA